VRLATINTAKAAGLDTEIGSLESGKRADLVMVDEGLNGQPAMVAGQVRHRADDSSGQGLSRAK
jgi:imidazolonepropionase-like amidohydrolase